MIFPSFLILSGPHADVSFGKNCHLEQYGYLYCEVSSYTVTGERYISFSIIFLTKVIKTYF